MALFLKIDGQTGPVTTDPHKGWFRLQSFSWGGIRRQLDESGAPTTTRVPLPFELVRAIDAASPVFLDALRSSATLGIVVSSDTVGDAGVSPTTMWLLKSTRVAAIRLTANDGGGGSVLERVTLLHGQVTVQHEPSKASFSDTGFGA